MYSVVHAVLVRPLPYPESDRIVSILLQEREGELYGVSLEVADALAASGAFEAVTSTSNELARLVGSGEPEDLTGFAVTPEFFRVITPPALGRPFRAPREIVISHSLWQRKFGGDGSVVGRVITLEPDAYTIVGVMPPRLTFGIRTDFVRAAPRAIGSDQHGRGPYEVFGRLRRDITIQSAEAAAQVAIARLKKAYPSDYNVMTVRLLPMKTFLTFEIDQLLLMLLGAVGFVLLIACTNVSTLLMVRGIARQRDLSVLASLGASRARLVQTQILEAMLLAVPGALMGIAAAQAVLAAMLSLIPDVFPRIDEARIDVAVGVVAILVCCAGTFVASVWPALSASRLDLVRSLTTSGGATATTRTGGLRVLIASEVALTTMLLAGAGVMGFSLYRLATVDLGVNTTRFVTAAMMPGARYRDDQHRFALLSNVADQVRAIPGVRAVSIASTGPVQLPMSTSVEINGSTVVKAATFRYRLVDSDYFSMFGIRLVRGRSIEPSDRPGTPRVAVINETAARVFPEGTDPIGRTITARFGMVPAQLEIVGIVKDVRQTLWLDPRPEFYVPVAQRPPWRAALLVSTDANARALEAELKAAVWRIDPALPLTEIRDFEDALNQQAWALRFRAAVLGLFAAASVVLALIGIWAVVAYAVVRRTREIGIRSALGATASNVFGLLLREAVVPAVKGIGVGVGAAFYLSVVLDRYVFGVTAGDPRVLAGIAVVMLVASASAAAIPARRALKIDPAHTLRAE